MSVFAWPIPDLRPTPLLCNDHNKRLYEFISRISQENPFVRAALCCAQNSQRIPWGLHPGTGKNAAGNDAFCRKSLHIFEIGGFRASPAVDLCGLALRKQPDDRKPDDQSGHRQDQRQDDIDQRRPPLATLPKGNGIH